MWVLLVFYACSILGVLFVGFIVFRLWVVCWVRFGLCVGFLLAYVGFIWVLFVFYVGFIGFGVGFYVGFDVCVMCLVLCVIYVGFMWFYAGFVRVLCLF